GDGGRGHVREGCPARGWRGPPVLFLGARRALPARRRHDRARRDVREEGGRERLPNAGEGRRADGLAPPRSRDQTDAGRERGGDVTRPAFHYNALLRGFRSPAASP